jgi:osmotically-inducible protein OsmY
VRVEFLSQEIAVPHFSRCLVIVTLALPFLSAGCNRQDADRLSSIGRKLAAHAKSSTGDLGAKVDARLKKEPTLQERIQDRLRCDKMLAEFTLEVNVKDKEVELKGNVKTAQQRQRALDLADIVGVDRVSDAIVVSDDS